jgi:hypothetical protein
MMSNYVIVVYVSFWSWHVHGSHSVCLPKLGVIEAEHDLHVEKARSSLPSYSTEVLGPRVVPDTSVNVTPQNHVWAMENFFQENNK